MCEDRRRFLQVSDFFLQKGGSDIVVGIALGFVLFEDGRRDDPYIRCICLQHNNETARYMWL